MKSLLVVSLILAFVQALYAVGNVVEDDIAALRRAGFRFENADFSRSGKSVRFTVHIPRSYAFGELGEKPFVGAACIKPENADASGPRLIGTPGARFPLVHRDEETGHTLSTSVLVGELSGTYLEFCFNQGSGYPPMLIHVPLKSVVDFLAKTTKAEQDVTPQSATR